MRLFVTLSLMCTLVVLAGCATSTRGSVMRRGAYTPTAARASAPQATYARSTRTVVREVARPAPTFERRLSTFTPPAPPALPAERVTAVRSAPRAVCAPAPRRVQPAACAPAPACDPCAGGNCGIPALTFDPCDPCADGSCGVPSLDLCR